MPIEPVAAAASRAPVAADGVGDGELERAGAERDVDLGAAVAVAGGVRQRLLQDPVGAAVDAGRERTPVAVDARS